MMPGNRRYSTVCVDSETVLIPTDKSRDAKDHFCVSRLLTREMRGDEDSFIVDNRLPAQRGGYFTCFVTIEKED